MTDRPVTFGGGGMIEAVDPLVDTRESWHAVAEHVLSTARLRATGRIGLRAAPGGFATPPFPFGAGRRVLAVRGAELVVIDDGEERAAPLTTLRAAGAFAGVEPGMSADVYAPVTPLDLDRPLPIDTGAAGDLAGWFQLFDAALAALVAPRAEDAAPVQLWPEHFDLATTIDRVNYGGSPGDDGHPEPYLYVGPHEPPAPDGFWNEPFGASRRVTTATDVDEALAFFDEGRRRLGERTR